VTRRTLGLGAIGAAVTGLGLPRLFRQSAKATSKDTTYPSRTMGGRSVPTSGGSGRVVPATAPVPIGTTPRDSLILTK
jgi:hypothetical protein